MSNRNPLTLCGKLIALAALAGLLLVACGRGSAGTTSTAPVEAGGSLALAEVEEVESFVPTVPTGETSIHMIGQIMEPLVLTNPKSELEPWLAKSYSSSKDGLTWTFQLREGVKFSNGMPLTATDVIFSLETVRKSPSWGFMFERIEKISAPSPTTVVISLSEPDYSLPAELSLFAADIVPKGYAGMSEEEFAEHPIGTGPFTLSSWHRGEGLTLVRNPNYWRKGEPLLDRIDVRTVTSANSRVSQLEAGELDAILAPPFAQLESLEQTPGLTVGRYAWGLINMVSLSSNSASFKDKRAREAFDFAIDREAIIKVAANGNGKPAAVWVPSSVPDWNPNIKPTIQDLPKAKKLLAEAVEDGADPGFTLLLTADDPYWSSATQIIQQELEEVGFHVTLKPLDISALNEAFFTGDYEAIAWPGGKPDIPDQSEYSTFYVATNGIGTGAPTDEIAKLANEARATPSLAKRQELYFEAQRIVNEERYFLPLDEQQYTWGISSDVTGLNTNLTGRPTLSVTGFTE